jgi:uncharacterized cupin superfamily protein
VNRVNVASADLSFDPEDPDGFRSGMARLGKLFAAEESGISVYELPPGQAICPYHWEAGEEEWILVLTGRPTLRTPAGRERLEPMDVAFFPRGPEGAHGVYNETEETIRVLMFSTVVHPTATVYPDSDKVGVWTGHADADVVVRRESAVEYFDGERGPLSK